VTETAGAAESDADVDADPDHHSDDEVAEAPGPTEKSP
jgi:hypothetical protein